MDHDSRDDQHFRGETMIERWKKAKWTLVSASPRRLNILKQIGISPRIIVPEIEELDQHFSPEELVKANSLRKYEFARNRIDSGILLAADTIVLLDNEILGNQLTLTVQLRCSNRCQTVGIKYSQALP